ncbi:d-alanine--d-alanine ligase [Fagus crenata]
MLWLSLPHTLSRLFFSHQIALTSTTARESLKFPPADLAFLTKLNHHLTLKTFRLPNTQYAPSVYSNTPANFDSKLERLESLSEFAEHLAASVDIVFPVIHGRFGEDGEYNIPFVGTGSNECRQAFDKYDASLELSKQGFITVPSFIVQGNERNESELSKWFARNQLDPNSGKVVVKPARAGSSIGVKIAYGVLDSFTKADEIISEGIDDKVLIEIFLEGGSEFTALVLDVGSGLDCHPVVLLPTEDMSEKVEKR